MNFLESFRAVFQSDVTATEQAVLLALIDHMPNCRPGVARIAQWAKVTERAVFSTLATLRRKGIVIVHQTPGKPNSYQLDLAKLPRSESTTPEPGSPLNDVHPCNTFMGPLNDVQSTPDPASPKGTNEGTKEGSNASRRTPKASNGKANPKPVAKTKPTDPRVDEVLNHFRSTFASEFGRDPIANETKDKPAITRALKQTSADDLKRAITLQLTKRRHHQFAPGGRLKNIWQILSADSLNNIFTWKPDETSGYSRQPEPEFDAGGYRPASASIGRK